jgi:hypothetical protein
VSGDSSSIGAPAGGGAPTGGGAPAGGTPAGAVPASGTPAAGSNPPGGAGDSAPKGSGSPDPKGADVGGKEGLKLRDAAEGFDDQQAEAYERGRAIFRPGTGAVVRDVHIYNTYASAISARNVAPGPGPVRHDVLVSTRRRYAQVDGYPAMMRSLRERRLLLLGGPPSSGRSTTALRLLDELARGSVSRLGPAIDLATLADGLEKGRGYLGELPERGPELTGAHADGLAELLRQCECHLVLVVPLEGARGEAFAAYGADCPAPDTTELLDNHIRAELTAADPDELEDELLELVRSARIQDALGPAPRVRDAVELAGLLVGHGRKELAVEQVEDACRHFAERQVGEWFTELRTARGKAADRERQLTAFRLAVAVLNEVPRGLILEAAEDLCDRLWKIAHPRRKPRRELTAPPDTALLAAARVGTGTGTITYWGTASVAAEHLKFLDDRYPQVVLSQAWRRHHNLRAPVVKWLRDLAVDDRPYVWVRAAQAAGVLCWVDFTWTLDTLVDPEGSCTPTDKITSGEAWRRRWFAALALDQAAQDDRLYPAVIEILRRYRRRGTPAQQCTAALALGFAVGHRALDNTLVELRILGTPQEFDRGTESDEEVYDQHSDVILAAGMSLARLLVTGGRRQVLDRLTRWTEPIQRRSVQLLALQTASLLADLRVRNLAESQFAGGRSDANLPARFNERRRWPLILAMIEDDPSLTAPIAQLFRFALGSQIRFWFSERLGDWMPAAQDDAACVRVLGAFLAELARDEANLELLRYLVQRRGHAWADPVRPDIVAQLLAALAPLPRG